MTGFMEKEMHEFNQNYQDNKDKFCPYFDIDRITPFIQGRNGKNEKRSKEIQYRCLLANQDVYGVENIIKICRDNYKECPTHKGRREFSETGFNLENVGKAKYS